MGLRNHRLMEHRDVPNSTEQWLGTAVAFPLLPVHVGGQTFPDSPWGGGNDVHKYAQKWLAPGACLLEAALLGLALNSEMQ